MQLRHGRLYATESGKRYRVQYDPETAVFYCLASDPSYWYDNGHHNDFPHLNLVTEIAEKRWVPIRFVDMGVEEPDAVYRRINGRHWQKQIDRSELVSPPPYAEPSKVSESFPTSGYVETSIGPFNWAIVDHKGQRVLQIGTADQVKRLTIRY